MEAAQISDPQQLQGTVADAVALYDVLDGKQRASNLLELVRQNYPPQLFQAMVKDISEYFGRLGVSGAAPPQAAGEKGEASGPLKDPALERIDKLENEFKTRVEQEAERTQYQERMQTVQKFESRISELAQKAKLEGEDIAAYVAGISAVIGKHKDREEMLKRIAEGKWSDVDRLFTEHHNRELARIKRWNDSILQQKTDRQNGAPKIPAGGAPPAPSEPQKRSVKTFEDRVAAGLEILQGGNQN